MNDLRERLGTLSEEGSPRGAMSVWRAAQDHAGASVEQQFRRRRLRRVPTLVVPLVVAVLVALVVASIAIVDRDGHAPQVGSTSPGERSLAGLADTSHEKQVADPLFLIPTTLPEGYELGRAYGGNRAGLSSSYGGSGDMIQQTWSKFDEAATRPVSTIWIQWGPPTPSTLDRLGDHAEELRRRDQASLAATLRQVRESANYIVRGRPASLIGVPLRVDAEHGNEVVGNYTLVWEQPAGHFVRISGETAHPGELKAFADGLHRRKDGGFRATSAPEGYRFVGEQPGIATDGSNWRAIYARDGHGDFIQVEITSGTERVPGTLLWHGQNQDDDPRIVTIGDRLGVATTEGISSHVGAREPPPGSTDTTVVRWLEPGNVMVRVSASNLSDRELLEVARHLKRVDQPRWAQLKSPSRELD